MKPLYIITARGGSKGIPRKNIRLLGGRPLIAYTIDAAIEAAKRSGGHILLSTDDTEIAEVSRSCGLTVDYMRPERLGGDNIGSREVILDAMDWASAQNITYDCIVLLQPTSPLRTADDITEAEALYHDDIDMVVSVCPSDVNPYFNMFEVNDNGYIAISKGDGLYTRRQACPTVYEQNGAVYVINPASLRAMAMGAFPRRVPFVMPRSRSIDLDTPDDWAMAEIIVSNGK